MLSDLILSDALEAIIGALFLDQGIQASQALINQFFADRLDDLTQLKWQKDPKTQLQEFMQAKRLELPEYVLVDTSGLAHEQTFTVKCTVSLTPEPCVGVGVSRKKAEQAAAEKMLSKLNPQFP